MAPTLHRCAGRCPRGPLFSSWGGPATKTARAPGAVPAGGRGAVQLLPAAGELSEHLPFGWSLPGCGHAPVCCCWATTPATCWAGWRGAAAGPGHCPLYGLLYVLLQLEQTALAVGSVALFLVLTAVMVLTRKVNWYGLTPAQRSTPPAMPLPRPRTRHERSRQRPRPHQPARA